MQFGIYPMVLVRNDQTKCYISNGSSFSDKNGIYSLSGNKCTKMTGKKTKVLYEKSNRSVHYAEVHDKWIMIESEELTGRRMMRLVLLNINGKSKKELSKWISLE